MNDLKDKLKDKAENPGTQLTLTVKNLMSQDKYKKRFEEILGKKAAGFISSVINTVNSNTDLKTADPQTVLMSAIVAATLDLPIDKNLGFAYIVPYAGKAQFQIGYKGFIQLAMRTSLYKTINATEVYEGELVSKNRLTGVIVFDESKKMSDKVIGYAAFFQLLNGFEKAYYMTIDQVTNHAKRYSKSFSKPEGRWQKDFNAMALKTVLKMLLSKYGILSIEMMGALKADQGIIKDEDLSEDSSIEYVDGVEYDINEGKDDVSETKELEAQSKE